MRKSSLLLAGVAGAGVYLMAKNKRKTRIPNSSGPHVVILGAGFGGLATAAKLTQTAGHKLRITIVDRQNYHLFTPLVYQAAACGIVPYDAAFPIREWTGRHGIRFRNGTVQDVDLNQRVVYLDNGEIGYDYLVIALGSTTNFFGNESASAHVLPLKTLEDAVAIRNHIIDTLEKAAASNDAQKRRELLTYVVVGGGATGVEIAGAIAGLLREVLSADYPVLRGEPWQVIVLEGGSKLLGHMGDEMATVALRELQTAGVLVRLNTRAKEVASDAVVTDDGQRIATRTAIWTTGVRVPDCIAKIPTAHGHGGSIVVDEYLRIKGRSDAYAIGDNASFTDPRSGKPVPLLAATAMQEGNAAAANIVRSLRRRELKTFHYRNLGNVVSVGTRSGVAEIAGRVIGGFAGWLTWRVVHIARLTSMRNQLATALDWTEGYFYDLDTARLNVRPASKAA